MKIRLRMPMKSVPAFVQHQYIIFCAVALVLFLAVANVCQGQTTLLSSVPPNNATGVSVSAPVIFTFSGPMNTAASSASFYTLSPPGAYPVMSVWSAGNTVLTCTPAPAFPGNTSVQWALSGQDAGGFPVIAQGSFTTGTGGTSGSGTNAITIFTLGKLYSYQQTSTAAPTPSATVPYLFAATTLLASNRTATSITVTLPSAAVSNLVQNPSRHEDYNFAYFTTNNSTFETTFPQGTYTFNVISNAASQQVADTLPVSMTQPNAPHITNYLATQSVNAAQPFTLHWDAFVGGTAADYIGVGIGNNVVTSPTPGSPGALNGTVTSYTVSGGALQPNSNYTATVAFYHFLSGTNATYATNAYRATATMFTLSTFTSAPPPVLTNAAWSGGSFSFDILTVPSQMLTILSSSNCALPLAQWQVLGTTNSPGSRVHITDPHSVTNRNLFYKARNGP